MLAPPRDPRGHRCLGYLIFVPPDSNRVVLPFSETPHIVAKTAVPFLPGSRYERSDLVEPGGMLISSFRTIVTCIPGGNSFASEPSVRPEQDSASVISAM